MTLLQAVAGHLPGLVPDEVQWSTLRFGCARSERLDVAVPVLTTAQMAALTERVRQASRAQLKTLTVSQIVAIVDRAVMRLLDPCDPVRQEADRLLPIVTGYDAQVVRLGLTAFLKNFRAPQLHRFVAEDFGNPKLLDEFQPRPKGGMSRAFGPDLLCHVWAGNVPALPLWSLVCGLLVKAGNIGKLPSAEPLFAGLFARLLAEVHPPLADCLAVVWWPGGQSAGQSAIGFEAGSGSGTLLLGSADTVLAYGSDRSLDAIRAQVPVTTRFLPFGHKLGFGLVCRAALDARQGPLTARQAAWDVARYDQQGCYSPHLFYVERGGKLSPLDFARALAGELAQLALRYPRAALTLAEGAAVAGWRQALEIEALAGSQSAPGDLILGERDSAWSVAYADRLRPLTPTATHRSVRVVAVDAVDEAIALLTAHRPHLQTVGVATTPEDLVRIAGQLGLAGVTRICAIGQMTAPEAGWHHDGRFNLLDLVQMVDIEAGAEAAAEAFAPYRS